MTTKYIKRLLRKERQRQEIRQIFNTVRSELEKHKLGYEILPSDPKLNTK